MSTIVTVGPLADLVPGTARQVQHGPHTICVVRCGDDVYAIGDACSHADISLSEGEVLCDTREIECWKHGSAFSLETGVPQTLPATMPVPTYTARVDSGQIVVEIA